ncbi:hypothetical protein METBISCDRAFT_17797 [Metschnikowia bicuspidata]|uniref:DNA dependent ATPase n=1 Tax=Metschnikowia bicuspidata TaxID=27322 RepID=A0A4P9ZAJ8_9ASCO|nr:hypothetical protein METBISCDRAFT_17797 [Metschnikowia bicuspidata]
MEEQPEIELVDQNELESRIKEKANLALLEKDAELDRKRLLKARAKLQKATRKMRALEARLANPCTKLSQRVLLRSEIENVEETELAPLRQDVADIQHHLQSNKAQLRSDCASSRCAEASEPAEDETERDFLTRTGKITAFGNNNAFTAGLVDTPKSHTHLHAPGFLDSAEIWESKGLQHRGAESKRTVQNGTGVGPKGEDENEKSDSKATNKRPNNESDQDEGLRRIQSDTISDSVARIDSDDKSSVAPKPSDGAELTKTDSNSDYEPNGAESDSQDAYSPDDADDNEEPVEGLADETADSIVQLNIDDGNESYYQKRLQEWVINRSRLRRKKQGLQEDPESQPGEGKDVPEWFKGHPTIVDAVLNNKFRLPGDIYPSLFEYQNTCVQWLWELYSQKTGGIIGDEMGLGKTVQVMAFLAGLHYSGLLEKPVLLVVPATVLNQWVNEFHRWWPPLRCVILHSIGSGMTKSVGRSEEQLEAMIESEDEGQPLDISVKMAKNQHNAREIVERVMEHGHVLITTYVGLQIYSKFVLPHEWGYVVLDEGHKIRNPNSKISLACKRIKTYNRIILSGTPIQNNLVELWSLFDFVFPGRLGTLPVFEQQFAVPIKIGGYANASNVQVQSGYKCAMILRDLISPYLLRRLKVDVAQDLPKKKEMVVFVKLTQTQQDMYERFLGSEDVGAIMRGKRNVLMGLDMLRKICNHPDLVDREALLKRRGYNYGAPARLGKMQVLKNLFQLWQSQGHRTLLFCQTKQMLDILEKFVANLEQIPPDPGADASPDSVPHNYFHFLRMDGSTPIARRQQLVDTFNSNTYYHVFLLTTKVGGLGINLTGADRVVIYDPDWNPSTDMQARERAWRLGQTKDITIYRLMTAGTIEEKIYHRQIFKTFLTNKILKDPKQRRFFKLNDLHDLFSLGNLDETGTETGDLFNGAEKTFSAGKERKSQSLQAVGSNDDFYSVARIQGVSKLDKFVDVDEDADDANKDDNRLMDGLFSSSGVVQSTLQHDDIVDSSRHDLSLVEREASQVAREAAEALRKSRLLARKTAVGTPTWTGKFGSAGRFGPKPKRTKRPASALALTTPEPNKDVSPLSSVLILSEVRSKKTALGARASLDHEALMQHLIGFLTARLDNFSASNAILASLPKTVDPKNEKHVVVVRSLLREVAEWNAQKCGWKLRASYL